MLKKIIFSFFIFFFDQLCSTVQIQDVQVKGPVGLKQIKGKYAGYVQTGGWQNQKHRDLHVARGRLMLI